MKIKYKYVIKGYNTKLHLSFILLKVTAGNEKEAIRKAKRLATRDYYEVMSVLKELRK